MEGGENLRVKFFSGRHQNGLLSSSKNGYNKYDDKGLFCIGWNTWYD